MTRAVCIHGHFYQPPRENPWLDVIEREPSAGPAHDWNARIAEECYTPNAAARLLDTQGRVVELANNYAHISFNFGATLLRWLEREAPSTYAAILQADVDSRVRNDGHGNAIAQVYNHAILPLANERDKRTQVRWGLADFKHRFGRDAEGIWLAETAIDQATLDVLAEEGVRFTLLSPYQAARFRVDGDAAWTACGDGSIPTGRAYRARTRSGADVALFFYDGGIARGIAFERMLSDASHLVNAVRSAHDHHDRRRAERGDAWLVHTATDGESYGHHFKFGEMALAAACARLRDDPAYRLTNYGAFLAAHPPRAEVELHPVSAWSCAHGVGRWERDCGCRMNADPSWNQKWRAGLRHALNRLRDDLEAHFERGMSSLCADPWAVRDAYIEVLLDAGQADAFFTRHIVGTPDATRRTRFFQLLELQRAALLMFTSCGWFFDDIAGGESVILMKYAARAMELGRRTGMSDPEPAFVDALAHAVANSRNRNGAVQTGRDIFYEKAKSTVVDVEKVVLSWALLASGRGRQSPSERLACYRVLDHEERDLTDAAVPCLVGRISLLDERSMEESTSTYVLVHFGGLDFRCRVLRGDHLRRWADRLSVALEDGASGMSGLVRILDDEIGAEGASSFGLSDAFADLREEIARSVAAERFRLADDVGAELVLAQRALLKGLVDVGAGIPPHIGALAAHVFATRARTIVGEILAAPEGLARSPLRRLRVILDDAKELQLTLDVRPAALAIEDALAVALAELIDAHTPVRAARVGALLEARTLVGASLPVHRLLPLADRLTSRARLDDDVRTLVAPLVEALDACCGASFAHRLRR